MPTQIQGGSASGKGSRASFGGRAGDAPKYWEPVVSFTTPLPAVVMMHLCARWPSSKSFLVIFPTDVWEYDVLVSFPFLTPEARAMAEAARRGGPEPRGK